MENAHKHILKSRTLWFNVVAALVPLLAEHVELLRNYLPDIGYLTVMMLTATVNVYLRTITTQPVRLGK